MFIKKDLRKIPTMRSMIVRTRGYDDEAAATLTLDGGNNNVTTKYVKHTEPLKSLKSAWWKHEFQGSVKILCEPSKWSRYIPKLRQLELLNLYDCNISNLDGIGDVFNSTNTPHLKMINLGWNLQASSLFNTYG
jgi:hypothetical protein